MNKKGSLQDIIFLGTVLLFFGMVLLFGFTITSHIDDKIQSHDVIDQQGKDASAKLTGYYPTILDNSFLFLAIGLAIVSLILATLVKVHPIFIPMFFIALLITIFVSGLLSNIYQETAANSEVIAYSSQLTFTSNVLTFLPLITMVLGIILMVVMYKLNSNE